MSVFATRAPLPILTSLRFFAAAEVVIYHEVYTMGRLGGVNFFLRDLASAGYEAVTFFFVLSGFILTYVYSGRLEHGCLTTSSREFWKARFARISPAYFLGLLVALPHFVYSTLISKTTAIPDFILGLALVPILQQAWWPPTAMAWNAPAWSLSVEFLFYACFPILALITGRLSRNYFVVLAYGLVISVAILRYIISSPSNAFDSPAVNFEMFFPLFHLPQFLFGMALGRLYLFGPTVSRKYHSAMLYAGAVGLMLVFGGRSMLPAWAHTDATLVLLFGCVIFGGAKADGALSVLAFPPLILLGEARYAMYILHMPLGWWWDWLTRRLTLPPLTSVVVYFSIVMGMSIVTYQYVEKPLRRRLLGHREHKPA